MEEGTKFIGGMHQPVEPAEDAKCAGNCKCKDEGTCKQKKAGLCKNCAWRGSYDPYRFVVGSQHGGCYFGNEFRRFVPKKHTCKHWVSDCILDEMDISREDFMMIMYGLEPLV